MLREAFAGAKVRLKSISVVLRQMGAVSEIGHEIGILNQSAQSDSREPARI